MKIKYPRTMHLSFSQGMTSDDKVLKNEDHLKGKQLVVTEKRDGENTTISREYYHARSLDSKDHVSRHFIKKLWSEIRFDIPVGMRICGENLYAKHSIGYDDLTTYFEVFSIWQDDVCLSWSETVEWCELLGLVHVPVLYSGEYSGNIWTLLPVEISQGIRQGKIEGFVVRVDGEFKHEDFCMNVAKFVRANHVQTDSHWMHSSIIANKLKE